MKEEKRKEFIQTRCIRRRNKEEVTGRGKGKGREH
jgi:hypothetical protein